MSKLFRFLNPVKLFSFAEEDAGGGEDKDKDIVSKADHDALVANNAKLTKDLEEMRMEVLSPDYMTYLSNKGTKKEETEEKAKAKETELTEEALGKLSPKELLALAEKNAKTALQGEMDKLRAETATDSRARSKREIAAFASTHDDFEEYRPIMHGFSLDPKHSHKPLATLYKEAKEYAARFRAVPTEEEKKKQKGMSTEKPGGGSESYADLRKLSTADATAKALDEVKKELGPIPLA